jgi:hypothetical protein
MYSRIIHQIWFQGNSLKPDYAKTSESEWRKNNPSFEYRHWDALQIEELIKNDFPELYEIYTKIPTMHQKIDFGKYAILHKHGGVIADSDSIGVGSLEPLLSRFDNSSIEHIATPLISKSRTGYHLAEFFAELLTLQPSIRFLNPAFQASVAGSIVTKSLLLSAKERIEMDPFPNWKYMQNQCTTGPRTYSVVLSSKSLRDKIYISENGEVWNTSEIINGETVSVHENKLTWLPKPIQVIYAMAKLFSINTVTIIILIGLLVTILPLLILKLLVSWRNFFLIMFFFGTFCLNLLSKAKAHQRISKNPAKHIPATDIVHENIGKPSYNWTHCLEATSFFICVTTMVYIYFKASETIITKTLVASIILMLLRAVFIFVTVYPSPHMNNHCSSGTEAWFYSEISSFFMDDRIIPEKSSHDMMFSGHVAQPFILVLTVCFIMNLNISYYVAIISTIIYSFFVVALKYHYTSDVIVAMLSAGMIHYIIFYNSRCIELMRLYTKSHKIHKR